MTAAPDSSRPSLTLNLPGFTWSGLRDASRLAELSDAFDARLRAEAPALFERFAAYRRAGGKGLPDAAEARLLIDVAGHLSRFVGALFGVSAEMEALRQKTAAEKPVLEFKKEFVTRRVFKKGAKDRPGPAERPALEAKVRSLLQAVFPQALDDPDRERAVATAVVSLLSMEKDLAGRPPASTDAPPPSWSATIAAVKRGAAQDFAAVAALPAGATAEAHLAALRGVLEVLDRWCFALASDPAAHREVTGWVSFRLPRPVDLGNLVELRRGRPELPEQMEAKGPEHLRRRDGFRLTDPRMTRREVLSEVDYCILCHDREKDSCSTGLFGKPGDAEPFKKNALGITLSGCPLDERIGEMHELMGQGDPVGALAMVCLDNPMLPGTGHRICNDCMKACIYQKQDPVNIPQIETGVLTDVLGLPWGFEIYSLLTMWNPLNVRRPHPLPYHGKNVLVVGLGPAGYTLAHHLLNEGFGVVGIDGLKIEPLPKRWLEEPVKDFHAEIAGELDERILLGFGGVSEYGITVRWDKNFLSVVYLTLARRKHLRIHGGTRFGGTLELADAWKLGFDHVAIAAGAGRPTLVPMKHNLIRGIRQASDFLMALQLTGAYKRSSMANLQVRLPAVVIGGGLTGIDTATELFAYYPAMVEKVLERFEELAARYGEDRVRALYGPEEREILEEFLGHGRAVRAERHRAIAAREKPDFVPLVKSWGGVSLVYRKSLKDSPAYRLNHEEIIKGLEEGIQIIENLSPVEAVPDAFGHVKAMRFERQKLVDGKWRGSGEVVELPARCVGVAAGTNPNVTYEKEHPGSFRMDEDAYFFRAHDASGEAPVSENPKARTGFFLSHLGPRGQRVSYYGDNHPQYAGSVVKAMASAKHGFTEVAALFEKDIAAALADPGGQASREAAFAELAGTMGRGLSPTVSAVNRLTPTIVEVVVHAPFAAEHFHPGQFYRLQNYETHAKVIRGTRLAMEGLALTGAWVDRAKGLLGLIVLEMGHSSRLIAALSPGEPVVLMGPTGAPTEIPGQEGQGNPETVVLLGGGLGNAVLFSIGKALKAAGNKVIYFAGYKKPEDVFKMDEIEAGTDQVIWSVDSGSPVKPRRPSDRCFVGNIVQAMVAYAKGDLGPTVAPLSEARRIIAIGSDRMMAAVKAARGGVLAPYLRKEHEAIGSINSPMQCMMKEICAQCLCKHVDPRTGKEQFVFSCFNQDQPLDLVDFPHLNERLRGNAVLERLGDLWLTRLLEDGAGTRRV